MNGASGTTFSKTSQAPFTWCLTSSSLFNHLSCTICLLLLSLSSIFGHFNSAHFFFLAGCSNCRSLALCSGLNRPAFYFLGPRFGEAPRSHVAKLMTPPPPAPLVSAAFAYSLASLAACSLASSCILRNLSFFLFAIMLSSGEPIYKARSVKKCKCHHIQYLFCQAQISWKMRLRMIKLTSKKPASSVCSY